MRSLYSLHVLHCTAAVLNIAAARFALQEQCIFPLRTQCTLIGA